MPIPHGIPGEHFISGDSEVVFYWSLPAATSTPMDDGAKVPKSSKDGFDVSCLNANVADCLLSLLEITAVLCYYSHNTERWPREEGLRWILGQTAPKNIGHLYGMMNVS